MRAEARAEADAERKKHLPSIRAQWVILPAKDSKTDWNIMNTAQGSVANYVSVHVDLSTFRVASALDWREIPGGMQTQFHRMVTADGYDFGVQFTVSWTDEHDRRLSSTAPHSTRAY